MRMLKPSSRTHARPWWPGLLPARSTQSALPDSGGRALVRLAAAGKPLQSTRRGHEINFAPLIFAEGHDRHYVAGNRTVGDDLASGLIVAMAQTRPVT